MSVANPPQALSPEQSRLRDEWLDRLSRLSDSVRTWAEESGWSTRQIDVRLHDSQLGAYSAPALLLQFETVKALLEPIARFAPGTEGVVDLYLMPAYDDIASLYLRDGNWHVHYMEQVAPAVEAKRDPPTKNLSRETLHEILEEMRKHAAQAA